MRAIKIIVLHLCQIMGLFSIARAFTRNKLLILCYHGFQMEDEAQFRPKLFISRETFRQRMELLSKYKCTILPLAEALAKLNSGTLPHKAITITIDDGFYSTYSIGADILKSHNFPSTVYVTTYYVINESPIFRLAIQYIFWKSSLKKLVLNNVAWSDDREVNMDNRERIDELMWKLIDYGEKNCSETERNKILKETSELLNVDPTPILEKRLLSLMTKSEIQTLSKEGVSIQPHTHRHRFPTDDPAIASQELVQNRDILATTTDNTLTHFCYPSGIWNKRHWETLDSLNMESATTCDPGLNTMKTPKFALKRFLDGDNITEIEFISEITGFSEILRSIKTSLKTQKNSA